MLTALSQTGHILMYAPHLSSLVAYTHPKLFRVYTHYISAPDKTGAKYLQHQCFSCISFASAGKISIERGPGTSSDKFTFI